MHDKDWALDLTIPEAVHQAKKKTTDKNKLLKQGSVNSTQLRGLSYQCDLKETNTSCHKGRFLYVHVPSFP